MLTPTERAAQIWCLPQFSSRVMDVEFGKAIAAAIQAAVDEERESCAAFVEDVMIYTGPGGQDPEPYQKAIAARIRGRHK